MKARFVTLFVLCLFLSTHKSGAHPGSGIVLDREGNVYFIDTGSGVWKIDRDGKLTKLQAPAYHWMAIDVDNRLAKVSLPNFTRGGATVTRDRIDPRIFVSSDFPITVGRDGSLYYPWTVTDDRVQIFRLSPSGRTTVLKTLPSHSEGSPLRWVNGIASAADGSIYYTEDVAIRRITPQGELTTVVNKPTLSGCDSVPGIGPELGYYFRDLAIDSLGTVYVAATGCRAVLKVTTDKKVTTVLRAPAPWSPTSVAVSGGDLYVLEYLHTAKDNRREWVPRVRKVSPDGRVVTVANIER